MKTTPSPVLSSAAFLAATLVLPATASAFAEIERGALTLTTTGRVAYDSNLTGRAGAPDDTVFTLAPTLAYNRSAGLGTIDASAGVAINRYVDLSTFDSEDITTALRVTLPTPEGARQQGAFTAGYTDLSDIDEDVGQRIRAKTWNTAFTGTFRAGPRTDLRANFGYADTNRDILADRTQWNANAGFDYADFLGGCGLEGDYRFSDTQSSAAAPGLGALDQTSHQVSSGLFYRFVNGLRASANVGYRWIRRDATETASATTSENGFTFGLKLDGPFLPASRFPKLKSSFSLGLEKGQALGLNDHGSTTLVGNLGLAWQARERTALTFNASRTQGLSSVNLSTLNNSVQLGVAQQLGQRTNLRASLAQDWISYPGAGRSDRRTRAKIDLACTLNRHWQAGAGYTATLARSDLPAFDYDRHLVSAFVSCTF